MTGLAEVSTSRFSHPLVTQAGVHYTRHSRHWRADLIQASDQRPFSTGGAQRASAVLILCCKGASHCLSYSWATTIASIIFFTAFFPLSMREERTPSWVWSSPFFARMSTNFLQTFMDIAWCEKIYVMVPSSQIVPPPDLWCLSTHSNSLSWQ